MAAGGETSTVYRASLHYAIDPPWTRMEPIRVGRVPRGEGTPAMYVLVERDEEPCARVDVYAEWEGCFRELIAWRGLVVLGCGDAVFVVDPAARRAREVKCDSYFGHLYPSEGWLLVASAAELIRIGGDGGDLWRRGGLGLDGVLVDRIERGVIEGNGEWDPPGGWRKFRVELGTGEVLAPLA